MPNDKESDISSYKGKLGGKRPGAGRPKGSVDKGNALIREMIVMALNGVGGVEYLQDVARTHPAAFMSLIGKTMPLQVTGDGGGAIRQSIEVSFRSAS